MTTRGLGEKEFKQVGLTGKDAEKILDSIHITVNKNTIPGETESPMVTSGIRLGGAAMTTRGLGEKEFKQVGLIISKALKNSEDKKILDELCKEVLDLTSKFPINQ
jgi:glycine hydroxymethyltransferase